MSDTEKMGIGGSIFGKYVNDTIIKSDADIVMLICDDDALDSEYLNNLNAYYTLNPNKNWAYCHVKTYNPEIQYYLDIENGTPYTFNWCGTNLNAHTDPIRPSCVVDSSQVTFRRSALITHNVWYPYPQTANLDSVIFQRMAQECGLCEFCGCYGQYKGVFNNQLGRRVHQNGGFF